MTTSSRDEFVERFAAMLTEAGMPRMPARVFVTLLAENDGVLTAQELAERLTGSAGAISGAVRYLVQVGLADREHRAGSRKDHFRVRPDVWYSVVLQQQARYARWQETLGEGVTAVGSDTPAGRRLAETQSFFDFLKREMPVLIKRWHDEERG